MSNLDNSSANNIMIDSTANQAMPTPRFGISVNGLHLHWPTRWPDLFGREAPLALEIGFGGGHFLTNLAVQHPDLNLIGVERSYYSVVETEDRLDKAAVQNVRLIYADARLVLAYICAPGTMDAIYVNFPDPFPKKAHAKRRLLTPETLSLIASRLKPGGQLTIATDVAAYAESIAGSLAHTAGLRNQYPTRWVNATPGRRPTRYERKALDRGELCYYFEYTRIDSTLPPPPFPLPAEFSMPNAILSTPLTFDQIAAQFTPRIDNTPPFRIHFLGMYHEQHNTALLIDTYVDEPLIEQRVGIFIGRQATERFPDHYVVRLDALGYPRPTPGAHAAVSLIVDWLVSLHPDSKILHRAIHENETK